MLAGLALNVGLSLWLVPKMGLMGAVVAAGVAHLAALVLILRFSRGLGLRIDLGTWIVLAAPAVLWLGPWAGAGALTALAAATIATDRVLCADEKAHLLQAWFRYRARFERFRAAWRRKK